MHQGRKRSASIASRALLAGALACALLATPAASGSPAPEPTSPATSTPFPAQLPRIAAVRVYQDGVWTLPGETPASVGRTLASLRPSWASSLIRYPKRLAPTGDEIQAWNTITDAVRAASPNAEFGIELNALQYHSAAEIERKMSQIRTRLDTDGWYMDFYTSAFRRFPAAVDAAIADAHDNGEWIGGNAFGLSSGPKVPPGSDFIAVQDFDFKIDLKAVRRLASQAPVVYHLGNNPQAASSDGCRWINELDTARRAAFLRHRAGQQSTYDFHVAYPVLFPGCERHPTRRQNPGLVYYNATRDRPMMQTIGRLMGRFDG